MRSPMLMMGGHFFLQPLHSSFRARRAQAGAGTKSLGPCVLRARSPRAPMRPTQLFPKTLPTRQTSGCRPLFLDDLTTECPTCFSVEPCFASDILTAPKPPWASPPASLISKRALCRATNKRSEGRKEEQAGRPAYGRRTDARVTTTM